MSQKHTRRNITLITALLMLATLIGATLIVMAVWGVSNSDNDSALCQTDKLTFDQSSACMNDGSVEFCIPADDPEALQSVKDITDDVQCGPGRGRVGCGEGQLLCMYAVRPPHCENRESTIAAAGWQTICAISELPFITQISPTWYE